MTGFNRSKFGESDSGKSERKTGAVKNQLKFRHSNENQARVVSLARWFWFYTRTRFGVISCTYYRAVVGGILCLFSLKLCFQRVQTLPKVVVLKLTLGSRLAFSRNAGISFAVQSEILKERRLASDKYSLFLYRPD